MERAKICLTLTGNTIKEDLEMIDKYRAWIDIAELRVDYLSADERLYVREFPKLAGLPCILTIRRTVDGGKYFEGEATRTTLFARALAFAEQDTRKNFAYIDLEADYQVSSLQDAALAYGTRIIRSFHNMTAPVLNLEKTMQDMCITNYEIPKVACMANSLSELTKLFKEAKQIKGFEHIFSVMGPYGLPSRILASNLNSFLTYTSPLESLEEMKHIGHIDPISLNEVYNFALIDDSTKLFGITGYPLTVTDSPILHNKGYRVNGMNSLYIPIVAKKVEEALDFADEMHIKGLSVTTPHKETVIPNLQRVSATVGDIRACNTILRQVDGWIGENTDAHGLLKALCDFTGQRNLWGKRVAIIGAGGAAKAAAYVVKQLRGKACIFNRTISKAKSLAEHYGFKYAELSDSSKDILELYSDLIIQTTSVGLGIDPNTEEDLSIHDPIPFYDFHGSETLYDIIYKPEKTPVMIRAEKAGCKVANGYSMFTNQGERQFSLFTGVKL